MNASERSLLQLVRDRLKKEGWYDSPEYWDMKAQSYSGLARSNWPSNSYNREVHARQMAALDHVLGDVSGLEVADVGCGTGRASLHLAGRGARVNGWDFSPGALEVARRDASDQGLEVTFAQGNINEPFDPELHGRFDIVLTIGCLTLACPDGRAFENAVSNLVALAKPRGRVLFVEPVHQSRLLRRILRMGIPEWIARCEAQGLEFATRGGLCFVPARYALAFRDLPNWISQPTFWAGERLLDASPRLDPLADYKWLLFQRRKSTTA